MSRDTKPEDRLAERVELYKILPLSSPLTVQIWVSDVCNFRCNYCAQSADDINLKRQYTSLSFMEMSTYQKIIDNIKKLGKLKKLILYGCGEPLCHPGFAEMVRYAKEQEVADTIETFSNGSLLTHDLSIQLVNSGLGILKISLQGLSAIDYKNVSDVEIDYNKFVDEIRFFYQNRGACKLKIKIMDLMIPTEELKQIFYTTFSGICDETMIESLIPTEWNPSNAEQTDHTVYGTDKHPVKVCPKPFFQLQINTDGTVRPCCSAPLGVTLGNAAESLTEIWYGKEYNRFLCSLLGKGEKLEVCKGCTYYHYAIMPSDILDGHEEELLAHYQTI